MRSRLLYALVAAGAIAAALSLDACIERSSSQIGPGSGSGSTGTTAGNFDKRALLRHLGEQVILPSYQRMLAASAVLRDTTAAYAAAPDTATRDAARAAWRDAMAEWQRGELMIVGPAAMKDVAPGGADLRDEIYSWPLVNRCRVDQELTESAHTDVSALSSELVNVRGLDALEYLLFNDSAANACPPQNAINSGGAWDAIAGELQQRRADYARTAAAILHGHVQTLHDAWSPAGGNFVAELARAGDGSSTYASAQEALNGVSDAMFYVDSETKDMKLAGPLGFNECATTPCLTLLESPYAHASKLQLEQNLLALELLYSGGPDGLGFDDWLIAVGAADLAQRLDGAIAAARTAVAAIEEEQLDQALQTDFQSVEDLYFAVKAITDLLKSEFVTVLDLDLPDKVDGDND